MFSIGTKLYSNKILEPRHDKTNKVVVRPAKTQISLGIRPVWSESSLAVWRNLRSLATHWAHSEDYDQTGRMPRLIWVFAGRTLILLVLSCLGSHHSTAAQNESVNPKSRFTWRSISITKPVMVTNSSSIWIFRSRRKILNLKNIVFFFFFFSIPWQLKLETGNGHIFYMCALKYKLKWGNTKRFQLQFIASTRQWTKDVLQPENHLGNIGRLPE